MKTAQACQVNGGGVPFFCLSCVRMQQLAAGSAVFDRPICMVTLFMKSRTFAAENQGKSKK